MDSEDHAPKLYKQKRATGADQFSEHQDEYETRGRPGPDRVGQVLAHNETYPKLRRELSKRKSVSKVRVAGVKNTSLLKRSKRPNRKAPICKKQPKKTTRVIKKRKKICSKSLPLKLSRKNSKSNQFPMIAPLVNKRIGTERSLCESHPKGGGVTNDNHEPNNENEIIFPTASRSTSGSSFHSFSTLEHEPMVS